jgi:hypothetical protein
MSAGFKKTGGGPGTIAMLTPSEANSLADRLYQTVAPKGAHAICAGVILTQLTPEDVAVLETFIGLAQQELKENGNQQI